MAPERLTSGALLEREPELRALGEAVLSARAGGGGLVVVDGPAGIGKTALLSAARAAAAEMGLLTLSARGLELEQSFGFGVARQLFDEVFLGEQIPPEGLFTGTARFAAPLLGVELSGAAHAPPEDPFVARHALYWLTANLAGRQPLALLVDDCHWADAPSLGVLAHIALRLEGIPVAVLVAIRAEESNPLLEALRRQAMEQGTFLRVRALGADAAATLVRSFAPEADEGLCRACHIATGGNPFLLHELARSSIAQGDHRSGAAERIGVMPEDLVRALGAGASGLLSPDHAEALSPERVTSEIANRLARLPQPAAALARAVAILGGDVPLRLAAALHGIDQDEAPAAADALVKAGVLRSSEPLEFLHPLVRAAVYAGLGFAARSRDHARAARLIAEESASAERVAAQLLHCVPAGDAWAYERLVLAARIASARGAPEAAIAYLRRALEEPPPPGSRTEILLALAGAEARAADLSAAIGHLQEVMAGEVEPGQRHRAAVLAAGLLGHAGHVQAAVGMLEEQIEKLGERSDLRASAEAALSNVARIHPAMHARVAPVNERLRERVEQGVERDLAVLGVVSTEMAMAAEPATVAVELALRVVSHFEPRGTAATDWSGFNAIRTLVLCGRYDEPLAALNRAQDAARERGSVLDVGGTFVFRSELYLHTGDLVGAELDARGLHEIARASGWTMGGDFATAWLGEALLQRGEREEAERELTEGVYALPAAEIPLGYARAEALLARGRLRAAQGRLEAAVEDFRECGARHTALGNISPIVSAWRSALAHVLLELGRGAEARELAAAELELARRVGAPRALSIALRALAAVEGRRAGLRLLREAADVIDESGAQLERARVYAALGAAIRRAGDAAGAREPLRLAVDLAHRCGAGALEASALAELRATGARPRRSLASGPEALTPSERRIAELAAAGQQNREIAEMLFVTTNTVEYHLRNAYRKLGIASRTELGGVLEPSAAR